MPEEAKAPQAQADSTPGKYIRTFETDSEALKAGGKAELAPFVKRFAEQPPSPPAPQPAAQPSSLSAAPVPMTSFTPPAPPPIEQDEYIRTFGADMRVAGEGKHPDLTPFKQGDSTDSARLPASGAEPQSSPLHTYSGDFSELVSREGAARATILAAEEDAIRPSIPSAAVQSASRGVWYVIAGVLLFSVGVGAAYYAYSAYQGAKTVVPLATVSAPIFVNERQEISGVGVSLAQAIEQSVAHPLGAGEVRFLYTAIATTSDNSVFAALQLPAPGALLRNTNAIGSMAGIVSAGGSEAPFFILSVTSYPDTFAAMLSWEGTLPRDLAAFFPPYVEPDSVATSTGAIATSTSAAPSLGWHDEVIANHDARVYRDGMNRTVLLYGYWDAETLVIARDEAAFTELLGRLATSRATTR